MKKIEYFVRWRHIPGYAMFTPLMYIGIDHSVIEAEENATEENIKIALVGYFKTLNLNYDEIRIEDFSIYKSNNHDNP